MSRYEATFEIDSRSDAEAAHRLLRAAYDTIREESRSVREGTDSGEALLDAFQRLRDAADEPAPGKLTVVYEVDEEAGFEA
jgi:uncharacterized protein YheU (UPF0270 family)